MSIEARSAASSLDLTSVLTDRSSPILADVGVDEDTVQKVECRLTSRNSNAHPIYVQVEHVIRAKTKPLSLERRHFGATVEKVTRAKNKPSTLERRHFGATFISANKKSNEQRLSPENIQKDVVEMTLIKDPDVEDPRLISGSDNWGTYRRKSTSASVVQHLEKGDESPFALEESKFDEVYYPRPPQHVNVVDDDSEEYQVTCCGWKKVKKNIDHQQQQHQIQQEQQQIQQHARTQAVDSATVYDNCNFVDPSYFIEDFDSGDKSSEDSCWPPEILPQTHQYPECYCIKHDDRHQTRANNNANWPTHCVARPELLTTTNVDNCYCHTCRPNVPLPVFEPEVEVDHGSLWVETVQPPQASLPVEVESESHEDVTKSLPEDKALSTPKTARIIDAERLSLSRGGSRSASGKVSLEYIPPPTPPQKRFTSALPSPSSVEDFPCDTCPRLEGLLRISSSEMSTPRKVKQSKSNSVKSEPVQHYTPDRSPVYELELNGDKIKFLELKQQSPKIKTPDDKHRKCSSPSICSVSSSKTKSTSPDWVDNVKDKCLPKGLCDGSEFERCRIIPTPHSYWEDLNISPPVCQCPRSTPPTSPPTSPPDEFFCDTFTSPRMSVPRPRRVRICKDISKWGGVIAPKSNDIVTPTSYPEKVPACEAVEVSQCPDEIPMCKNETVPPCPVEVPKCFDTTVPPCVEEISPNGRDIKVVVDTSVQTIPVKSEPEPEPKPVIPVKSEPEPEPKPVIPVKLEPEPEPKPVIPVKTEPEPEPEPKPAVIDKDIQENKNELEYIIPENEITVSSNNEYSLISRAFDSNMSGVANSIIHLGVNEDELDESDLFCNFFCNKFDTPPTEPITPTREKELTPKTPTEEVKPAKMLICRKRGKFFLCDEVVDNKELASIKDQVGDRLINVPKVRLHKCPEREKQCVGMKSPQENITYEHVDLPEYPHRRGNEIQEPDMRYGRMKSPRKNITYEHVDLPEYTHYRENEIQDQVPRNYYCDVDINRRNDFVPIDQGPIMSPNYLLSAQPISEDESVQISPPGYFPFQAVRPRIKSPFEWSPFQSVDFPHEQTQFDSQSQPARSPRIFFPNDPSSRRNNFSLGASAHDFRRSPFRYVGRDSQFYSDEPAIRALVETENKFFPYPVEQEIHLSPGNLTGDYLHHRFPPVEVLSAGSNHISSKHTPQDISTNDKNSGCRQYQRGSSPSSEKSTTIDSINFPCRECQSPSEKSTTSSHGRAVQTSTTDSIAFPSGDMRQMPSEKSTTSACHCVPAHMIESTNFQCRQCQSPSDKSTTSSHGRAVQTSTTDSIAFPSDDTRQMPAEKSTTSTCHCVPVHMIESTNFPCRQCQSPSDKSTTSSHGRAVQTSTTDSTASPRGDTRQIFQSLSSLSKHTADYEKMSTINEEIESLTPCPSSSPQSPRVINDVRQRNLGQNLHCVCSLYSTGNLALNCENTRPDDLSINHQVFTHTPINPFQVAVLSTHVMPPVIANSPLPTPIILDSPQMSTVKIEGQQSPAIKNDNPRLSPGQVIQYQKLPTCTFNRQNRPLSNDGENDSVHRYVHVRTRPTPIFQESCMPTLDEPNLTFESIPIQTINRSKKPNQMHITNASQSQHSPRVVQCCSDDKTSVSPRNSPQLSNCPCSTHAQHQYSPEDLVPTCPASGLQENCTPMLSSNLGHQSPTYEPVLSCSQSLKHNQIYNSMSENRHSPQLVQCCPNDNVSLGRNNCSQLPKCPCSAPVKNQQLSNCPCSTPVRDQQLPNCPCSTPGRNQQLPNCPCSTPVRDQQLPNCPCSTPGRNQQLPNCPCSTPDRTQQANENIVPICPTSLIQQTCTPTPISDLCNRKSAFDSSQVFGQCQKQIQTCNQSQHMFDFVQRCPNDNTPVSRNNCPQVPSCPCSTSSRNQQSPEDAMSTCKSTCPPKIVVRCGSGHSQQRPKFKTGVEHKSQETQTDATNISLHTAQSFYNLPHGQQMAKTHVTVSTNTIDIDDLFDFYLRRQCAMPWNRPCQCNCPKYCENFLNNDSDSCRCAKLAAKKTSNCQSKPAEPIKKINIESVLSCCPSETKLECRKIESTLPSSTKLDRKSPTKSDASSRRHKSHVYHKNCSVAGTRSYSSMSTDISRPQPINPRNWIYPPPPFPQTSPYCNYPYPMMYYPMMYPTTMNNRRAMVNPYPRIANNYADDFSSWNENFYDSERFHDSRNFRECENFDDYHCRQRTPSAPENPVRNYCNNEEQSHRRFHPVNENRFDDAGISDDSGCVTPTPDCCFSPEVIAVCPQGYSQRYQSPYNRAPTRIYRCQKPQVDVSCEANCSFTPSPVNLDQEDDNSNCACSVEGAEDVDSLQGPGIIPGDLRCSYFVPCQPHVVPTSQSLPVDVQHVPRNLNSKKLTANNNGRLPNFYSPQPVPTKFADNGDCVRPDSSMSEPVFEQMSEANGWFENSPTKRQGIRYCTYRDNAPSVQFQEPRQRHSAPHTPPLPKDYDSERTQNPDIHCNCSVIGLQSTSATVGNQIPVYRVPEPTARGHIPTRSPYKLVTPQKSRQIPVGNECWTVPVSPTRMLMFCSPRGPQSSLPGGGGQQKKQSFMHSCPSGQKTRFENQYEK